MVREAFAPRTSETPRGAVRGGQASSLIHAYKSAMLYGVFDFQQHRTSLLGAFIYSFGLNVCTVGTAVLSAAFISDVPPDLPSCMASTFVYTLALFLYCCPVAYLHLMAVPYIPFPARLVLCVSSLSYLPAALLVCELEPPRCGYAMVALTAYSSSFVGKNTIQRSKTATCLHIVMYTVFVVVTQYLCIHLYKDSIFFSICGLLLGGKQAPHSLPGGN